MTIWQPDLTPYSGPRYKAIADALAADITNGMVSAGDQLPTHRDLAYHLGITVGTVSRAYAEAERRGLTCGEVGRGTFVIDPGKVGSVFAIRQPLRTDIIDMSMNRPPTGPAGEKLAKTLAELSQADGLATLTEYQPANGMPAHREASALLLGEAGLDVSPDAIVMTNGVQHSMAACLMALGRSGGTVLVEELTYPAVKPLARRLGMKLKPIAIDGEGLIPDALEAACAQSRPDLLYCMPTVHNPTGATMSEARRQAIADIINAHALPFIEDEVYGFMPEDRPPALTHYAPDYGYYLTSTAKSVAPGLRVGYVASAARDLDAVSHAVRLTGWMIPPLMGEISTRWILDGTTTELINWHRREAAVRFAIAEDVLSGLTFRGQRTAYHLWLELPAHIRVDDVITTCTERGIAVTPPESFCPDHVAVPNAIRVCTGAPKDRATLKQGLEILRDAIERPTQLDAPIL